MSNVRKLKLDDNTGGLKEEITEFKRRRIREEACHLFYLHGYESATIDAIAQRLDVTKPFIYSYYKNKSELLYDLCKLGIALSLEAIDEATANNKTPGEQLKLLIDRVARIIIDYQEYIVVYVREEKNLASDQARKIRQQRNLFDHRLGELLERGQNAGEFSVDDPVLTATTIGGMMTWVALWYSPAGTRTETEIITHVMSMIESAVSTATP